jgi:hypothetical protein
MVRLRERSITRLRAMVKIHVQTQIVGFDDRRQRTALAKGEDVAGRVDSAKSHASQCSFVMIRGCAIKRRNE